jgi:phosphonate transport system substrate-binding protein
VGPSYVLYRLDCALRASAVLGLVGAGGIGVQLELSLKMLAYDEVAAMILALLAVVAAVDGLSALARARLRAGTGPLPAGRGGLVRVGAVVAAWGAAFAASAARLDLPAGELLSAAPLRSVAAFVGRGAPPDLSADFLRRVGPAVLETLAVSVVGTALAAALGLALAWAAARPPSQVRDGAGSVRRAARVAGAWGARGAMNLLRTMPELLWALLLVLAVGLGPFAGALALGLHTAGVLGRLYVEALEEVAPGPVEALEAAGAGPAAASLFGVLPQVFPQLVAYTLYRWEVNVRASAVLGVVGAGGLGTLLQLSLGLLHLHRTLTLVLVIVVLVIAVDLASSALRGRLVGTAPPGQEGLMHRRVAVAAVSLLLVVSPALARAAELRVSAIPDESPTELLRKFEPLGAYLHDATGLEVRFVPVTDYAATVEGLAAGKLDLVWYGGFTFVQARRRTGNALPLVQRAEDARFHSKFIVGAGSKARTLADLKGASFAFGAVSSTSGHLMPRYFLLKQGIDPDRDFAKVAFSGAHDVTAKWVEAGKVDAGVLNESIWQRLVDEKKVDLSKVRVLETTPEYHDYNWTVRGDLDPKVVDALRKAFIALDPANPAQKRILDLQRASRFVPTSPENYAAIEQAARAAGLLSD